MTRKEMLIAIAIVALGAIAAGIYFYYQSRAQKPLVAAIQTPGPSVSAPAVPEQEAPIQNPIPADPGESAPAPALDADEADAPLLQGLNKVFGTRSVAQFVVPQMLVRHVVATIDNLPRKKAPLQMWPVKPTPGKPLTSGPEDALILSAESYARYAPLVHAVQSADMKQLSQLYMRFYPTFQKAYEELGFPSKYFNDRLVAVIDDLLATPDVTSPIALEQPNVLYTFKDPALENLSAGQKVLIRMGPENAAIVKQKLRELRGDVATGSR
jgi:hypothetical protein